MRGKSRLFKGPYTGSVFFRPCEIYYASVSGLFVTELRTSDHYFAYGFPHIFASCYMNYEVHLCCFSTPDIFPFWRVAWAKLTYEPPKLIYPGSNRRRTHFLELLTKSTHLESRTTCYLYTGPCDALLKRTWSQR